MKAGGRRELIVPADMSFHEIPLIYVIELLRVEKIDGEGKDGGAARALTGKLTIPKQSGPPPRHIEVIDLRKGTGAVVRPSDAVRVRFFQVLYPEVQKRSRTGVFGPDRYGLDETVKGWKVGLPGMRVGGRRELILPPKLKFPGWEPSWGYTPYVSIYVVDLLGVEPAT